MNSLKLLRLSLILLITGCRGSAYIADPSIQAVEAGDYTLAISGCSNVPGGGMDICRVKEGADVDSVWRLIVPVDKRVFLGGELTVYFKDVSKTYAITSPLIEIPWKDFLGATKWERSHDGQALALAQIRYKNQEGIEEIWKARGLAIIVVTKPGYDPLPLDSGFVQWGSTCKIQYSSQGRGVVSCK
jgi:hypothetical protein